MKKTEIGGIGFTTSQQKDGSTVLGPSLKLILLLIVVAPVIIVIVLVLVWLVIGIDCLLYFFCIINLVDPGLFYVVLSCIYSYSDCWLHTFCSSCNCRVLHSLKYQSQTRPSPTELLMLIASAFTTTIRSGFHGNIAFVAYRNITNLVFTRFLSLQIIF